MDIILKVIGIITLLMIWAAILIVIGTIIFMGAIFIIDKISDIFFRNM